MQGVADRNALTYESVYSVARRRVAWAKDYGVDAGMLRVLLGWPVHSRQASVQTVEK